MSIPHAQPGTVINVQPLGEQLAEHKTHTLVKTETLEIIRLVLPAGKEISTHSAPGQMTLQCLEGHITFTTMGNNLNLEAGSLLYLNASEPHSLSSIENSSLLLTITFPNK